MPYTAQHVANFFLDKAEEENLPITQMKLLKLAYFAYGWVYAVLDKALFLDEIEAWKHGPVIPSLYHEFKEFGSKPIDRKAICFDLDTEESTTPQIDETDIDTIFVLNTVWGIYKRFSAAALRDKTHEADTPWKEVFKPYYNIVIPIESIKKYFSAKITEYLSAAPQ
jgi:uncharacterized phage-associated protein